GRLDSDTGFSEVLKCNSGSIQTQPNLGFDIMETEKKKSKRKYLAVFITLILAVLLAGIFFGSTSAQDSEVSEVETSSSSPTPAAEPAAKLDVYKVAEDAIITEVLLTGEMRAERSVAIDAPDLRSSSSQTITFLAPEGSKIKKGDLIVEFDDSSLLSQQSEAERTLDEAKLKIEKTKADLEAERCDLQNSVTQAEADLEIAQLYGKISKDLLPANTYQQYQLNLEQAKLSLQKAQEQLDNFKKTYASEMALVEIDKSQAEINLKQIDNDMRLLKINAPQDGILVYGDDWRNNRKIQVGDQLRHGQEAAELPDLSSMQMVGNVYDTEYGLLSTGMRGTITLDALPDFKMGGKIISLTNVGTRKAFFSEKKVFQAIIKPDEVTPEMMKPGMTARVKFRVSLANNVPAVPREYIGVDPQSRYYVYKGTEADTASMEFVQIGKIGDRLAQVVSGVSVGDPLLPIQHTEEVLQ
ncbi:MAG: efflux RND transporter periplasmic adaptor subunit, partial [Deltaproteobacteria bacterium]